ncbi:MAG: response regulator with CheY-like receiver domain and winged-helix DNA-binding domain [Acidimicrobiaceae bacterium]|nr:response regulator with CheY-like receiver domain and winged-helix DNA-binding domain [Acidimicrobiaceae bacterium]
MTADVASRPERPERTEWPQVLVVEDDESHVLALTVGLEREGLAVTAIRDGRDAVEAAERLRPDVILLDVMLPGTSGIEICRELRARGHDTPIIFVSARSEELDVVVGIEVGADDYVPKPYRMRELVARIGALLRRRRAPGDLTSFAGLGSGAAIHADHSDEVLRVGDVVLDPGRHEVAVRGEAVDLPLREFQLLRELLANAGRVVTRDALLERVWGIDYDGDPRIVATLVGRLRARVEEDPDEPARIVTIRGVGYRYNDRR